MSTREEKINYIQEIYKDFTKAAIEKVLIDNGEDVNRALDVLMNYDAIENMEASTNHPVKQQPNNNPRYPELADLAQMFAGPDLTMSVIDGVFLRNLGDMTQTVETLINISNEKDAIAEIRKMSEAEKKALVDKMQKDQKQRNEAAKQKIEQQIAADEQRMKKLQQEKEKAEGEERKVREEEKKRLLEEQRKKEELEHNTRALQVEMQRIKEEQQKERAALEAFRQKLEMEKKQTAQAMMVELEKQKAEMLHHKNLADREKEELARVKVEQQRQHEEAQEQQRQLREAQELLERKEREAKEKQRILEETLQAQRVEAEKNKQLLVDQAEERAKEAAKEAVKAESEDKTKEIEQIKDQINHFKNVLSKIDKQPDLCTLSVRYDQNSVLVSWVLGKDIKPHPDHWIGFYRVGQPLNSYRDYHKTGGEISGGHSFRAPRTPGVYQFKYFVDSSYGNPLAESEYIRIGPSMEITAALAQEGGHNNIKVTYSLLSGQLSPEDWFGLYSATEINNAKYLHWQRIGPKFPAAGEQETINFSAPRTPGDYVVRFFPKLCKYTHFASSSLIRIQNKDKITAEPVKDEKTGRIREIKLTWQVQSVDPSTSDYVAIYKILSPNSVYITYKYVDPKTGTLVLDAPTEVGTYDVRYHSASLSKCVDVCRSNEIEIPNTDSVNALYEHFITVTYNIHSHPKNSWDWIGIYHCEEQNNKNFVDWKYVDMHTSSLAFERTGHTYPAGQYEARYFSAALGKFTDFRKSLPFALN